MAPTKTVQWQARWLWCSRVWTGCIHRPLRTPSLFKGTETHAGREPSFFPFAVHRLNEGLTQTSEYSVPEPKPSQDLCMFSIAYYDQKKIPGGSSGLFSRLAGDGRLSDGKGPLSLGLLELWRLRPCAWPLLQLLESLCRWCWVVKDKFFLHSGQDLSQRPTALPSF